ncbi:MFS transporter [Effusibacillus pohliae]|uniref:MFS transporter n=1 Tax=Effusibacillus pohliae TaxID=232270 RepID=UPI000376D082|nr:MFS transporter [Effusibacillus pohliae]
MGQVRGFFEYKILPEKRAAYLRWSPQWKQLMRAAGLDDFAVLESNQRPNQFLETFTVESIGQYESIVQGLTQQAAYRELRARLDELLEGGRERMKIWFFTEMC